MFHLGCFCPMKHSLTLLFGSELLQLLLSFYNKIIRHAPTSWNACATFIEHNSLTVQHDAYGFSFCYIFAVSLKFSLNLLLMI